jgi:hypothetical protein
VLGVVGVVGVAASAGGTAMVSTIGSINTDVDDSANRRINERRVTAGRDSGSSSFTSPVGGVAKVVGIRLA